MEDIQRKQALLKSQNPPAPSPATLSVTLEPQNVPPTRSTSPTPPPTQPQPAQAKSFVNTPSIPNQPSYSAPSQANSFHSFHGSNQAFIDNNYIISNNYSNQMNAVNYNNYREKGSLSLLVTQQNSYGYYVTSDSPYGNPIIPVLPRF